MADDGHVTKINHFYNGCATGVLRRFRCLLFRVNHSCRILARCADEAGYQVVRTYIETRDASPEWPAVAQLLDDAASLERDFDAVMVWSFARFSRNVQRFIALRRTLSDAGGVWCP